MAPVPVIRARIASTRIMRPTGYTKAAPRTPATHFSLVRFVPGNKLDGYEAEERPLFPLVLTKEDLGGARESETEYEGEEEEEEEEETTHVSETEYDSEDEEDRDGAQPDPLLMLSSAARVAPAFPPAQLRPAAVKRHIYIVKDSDDEADGPSEEVVEEHLV